MELKYSVKHFSFNDFSYVPSFFFLVKSFLDLMSVFMRTSFRKSFSISVSSIFDSPQVLGYSKGVLDVSILLRVSEKRILAMLSIYLSDVMLWHAW